MASNVDLAFSRFSEYYNSAQSPLREPPRIRQREFGFLSFGKARMLRHKGFGTGEDLRKFLGSVVPLDAYHSSAYYERPEADMDEKGWLGADLVFDIDADHIPTPCSKVHDRWICGKCDFAGKGPSPEKCPVCGETKFNTKTWICDVCLESAKSETVKLIDMLTKDFGFADSEVRVYFSGNRGYHVHVENESAYLLDSPARKEIVDYVIGLGFELALHRVLDGGRVHINGNLHGWRQRIAKGIETFLERASLDHMEKAGLTKRVASLLNKNREDLLSNLRKNGRLDMRGVEAGSWRKIVEWATAQESVKIDTVVTTDTHRLIRLAGSLHGKTGLMKAEASLGTLDSFDPLKEAVAFKKGHVLVDLAETPQFRIADTVYGPFQNATRVELPTAAALFLICKGAARAVER